MRNSDKSEIKIYKTVRLKEDTWQKLALVKAKTKAKTFDEIIHNMVRQK